MRNNITEILRIVHEQSVKFISKLDRDFSWETHVEVVFSLEDVDTYRIILFIKDHPYGAILMNNYREIIDMLHACILEFVGP